MEISVIFKLIDFLFRESQIALSGFTLFIELECFFFEELFLFLHFMEFIVTNRLQIPYTRNFLDLFHFLLHFQHLAPMRYQEILLVPFYLLHDRFFHHLPHPPIYLDLLLYLPIGGLDQGPCVLVIHALCVITHHPSP